MRAVVLALAGAVLLSLFVALPCASAQVPGPYGVGPTAPFYVPQAGIDPAGRPYRLQVAGAYGPYDGQGYPVIINTVGIYGGVPVARTTVRYVPVPFPLAPFASYGPPVAVPLLP
jgi:hypothetical protein